MISNSGQYLLSDSDQLRLSVFGALALHGCDPVVAQIPAALPIIETDPISHLRTTIVLQLKPYTEKPVHKESKGLCENRRDTTAQEIKAKALPKPAT
ncbi:hypothetical protein [Synechococcus sp. MIT S9504]|uniref:hypothetical protein n=1 Tax=Synechococcus sp. MIT S9504 TaxID=1801628 RepID=UPI0012E7B0F5|nr:hypothetical protein [Synechococcus sp. MIT S9504]